MLEITIHIEAEQLVDAINNLAVSLRSGTSNAVAAVAIPAPSSASAPAQSTPIAPAPKESQPVATTVPVAAPPQYTTEQIMEAGATLMDAGKINELMALLQRFGVQAVMDLKPEQLGPFATAMRELGAKI